MASKNGRDASERNWNIAGRSVPRWHAILPFTLVPVQIAKGPRLSSTSRRDYTILNAVKGNFSVRFGEEQHATRSSRAVFSLARLENRVFGSTNCLFADQRQE